MTQDLIEPGDTAQVPALSDASASDFLMRAIASNAPPEIIDKFIEMYERFQAIQARAAYNRAMAKAKAKLPASVLKTREVSYTSERTGKTTSYKHEDLGDMVEICTPILAKYGLSHNWELEELDQGRVRVTCVITHEDGHAVRTPLSSSPDTSGQKNDLQAKASAISYLERYTYKAALGLASSYDDDGLAGGGTETVETLSENDILELEELCKYTGIAPERVAKSENVETLAEIPATRFKPLKDKLLAQANTPRKGKQADAATN